MFVYNPKQTSFNEDELIQIYKSGCNCTQCITIENSFRVSNIRFYLRDETYIYATRSYLIALASLLYVNLADYPRYDEFVSSAYRAVELKDPRAMAEIAAALVQTDDKQIDYLFF